MNERLEQLLGLRRDALVKGDPGQLELIEHDLDLEFPSWKKKAADPGQTANNKQTKGNIMDSNTQSSGSQTDASAEDYQAPGCTCDGPSEYNYPNNVAYHRHGFECALAPNLNDGWLFYQHDGELEEGGVWVHPADKSCIYLEVNGYLCRTPVEIGESKLVAFSEKQKRLALENFVGFWEAHPECKTFEECLALLQQTVATQSY
jgi:hypothetical protein